MGPFWMSCGAPGGNVGPHCDAGSVLRMQVAITGASGLIGKALAASLQGDGHEVLPVSRSPKGPEGIQWDPSAGTIDAARLDGVDAVVHLAGEPIASKPWTDAQ